jgi:hypothetical protein
MDRVSSFFQPFEEGAFVFVVGEVGGEDCGGKLAGVADEDEVAAAVSVCVCVCVCVCVYVSVCVY